MHFLNTIYVNDSASVSADNRTDYHWFTSKLAHENQHERDWRNEVWAGNPYNPQEDIDQNFLRDYWESNEPDIKMCGDDPIKRYVVCYRKWADNRAYSVENNYPDNSSTNDWAFPGYNYK
jgi:hypothetical protein